MVHIDEVRELARSLPRSAEAVVRNRIKFRVGRLVYLAFSPDESMMGCAFAKEERLALVEGEPHKFSLPSPGDMRYNWVHVRLGSLDRDEMHELVVEAWTMVVPQRLAREHLAGTRFARLPPQP